jgi:hypothetical protein
MGKFDILVENWETSESHNESAESREVLREFEAYDGIPYYIP